MKWFYDRRYYFVMSLISFCAGLGIVFFFKNHAFIRGFMGDVLVVIFIFSSVKIFFPKINSLKLGLGVFCFASIIEFLQLFKIAQKFNLKSRFLIIVLGNTFDFFDLIAYLSGVLLVVIIDKQLNYSKLKS